MSNFTFVENLNKEEFNSLAKNPDIKSHFLGSWEWGKVCSKRNWIPHYVGVKEDGQLVATALLLQRKLYLGYCYFYIPRGFTLDYRNRDLIDFLTSKINKYCKKRHSIFFKIDPDIKLHTIDIEGNIIEGENNYDLVNYLSSIGYQHRELTYFFETEQPRFTFRIPLNGTIEEIYNRYGRTTKNCIKTAIDKNVNVFIGGADNINDFNRLMKITELRQDFYSHEEEYFAEFYQIFKDSNMCDLYFGEINIPTIINNLEEKKKKLEDEKNILSNRNSKKARNKLRDIEEQLKPVNEELNKLKEINEENVIVSAYMNVNYGNKSWTLYAGNDMNYRKFYGNYLVYQKQIEDAINKGFIFIDGFGTPGKPEENGKSSGLFEFKKKWGGEFIEFIGEFDYIQNKPMYFLFNKAIPIYRKLKNRILRKNLE